MKEGRALRRLLVLAVVALGFGFSSLRAADAIKPVPHGSEIRAEAVGPDVFGFEQVQSWPGATITDQSIPRYAKRVAETAAYDGFEVLGPHLLIENVVIEGALDVGTWLPVVLRRVIVQADRELPWLVLVRPGAGPLHVLWSDIGGAMRKTSVLPHVGVALALRGDGARIHRSRIGAAADGIQIAARDIRVTESRIADLLSRSGDHNDAIQLFDQAETVEIARNAIENKHPQTSAVTVLGKDVALTSNWLAGGGWTLYGGAKRNGKGEPGATGLRVTDNIFARGHFPQAGSFGPVTYWAAPPGSGNVWQNNRDEGGKPVTP